MTPRQGLGQPHTDAAGTSTATTTTAPKGRPRRIRRWRMDPTMPRDIYVLSLVAFIVSLGFGIVGPAIPLLAESFGVGKTIAAAAISAFALFRFVSALLNGRLVEIFDTRRVLATGLIMQAVTTFAAGLAPDFLWVVILRALGGLGSAAFTVAAMALLLQIAPPSHRGRAAGTFQGGFLLGGILGPAAGGFLAEISSRLPFLVYGVFLAIAGTVGMAMLSKRPKAPKVKADTNCRNEALLAEHADEGGVGPLRTEIQSAEMQSAGLQSAGTLRAEADDATDPVADKRGRSWKRRAFIACLIANLGVGWMLYGVRSSLMPVYVVEELGKTAAWAGAAFLVGSIAQGVVLLRAGKLVDTWGRKPTMLIGSSVTTLAILMLLFPPTLWIFLVSMAAFGAAGAFLGSAPAAVLGDISDGGNPGRRVAGFQMASDGGAIIGPLVAGLLVDTYSYQVAFASGAAVLFLGVISALVMPETGIRQRSSRKKRQRTSKRRR